MRILVLTNMYPPHHYGGYELSCHDVMRRFAERGHSVSVLTSDLRVPGVVEPGDERASGIRRELEMYWDDHVLVSPRLPRRLTLERRNQRRLAEVLGKTSPDVVSVWNMGAMSLGLLTTVAARDIPMVLNLGDDWLVYGPRLDAWSRLWLSPRRRLGAQVVAKVTGVPTLLPDLGALGACCFNSDATRRFAAEHTSWSFPRTGVVYSGIEATDFPLEPPLASVAERPWRGRMLFVGRVDRRKGIETAIAALPSLTEARLRVIGQGEAAYLDEMRALAVQLGVVERVAFASALRSQLRSEYQAADVCVFPSTWAEPFGLVPLEAMACDTPVVATGTGGSGEFLEHERNCLLYPAGDEVALANAVSRLASDAALRTTLIRNGRATAGALTTDALADALEEWHRAAAEGYAHGVPSDRRLPGRVPD